MSPTSGALLRRWPLGASVFVTLIALGLVLGGGTFEAGPVDVPALFLASVALLIAGVLEHSRRALLIATATSIFAFAVRAMRSLVEPDVSIASRLALLGIFGLLTIYTAVLAALDLRRGTRDH